MEAQLEFGLGDGISTRRRNTIHREEHVFPPLFPWVLHPDAESSRGLQPQ